jgi:hypothetical protein
VWRAILRDSRRGPIPSGVHTRDGFKNGDREQLNFKLGIEHYLKLLSVAIFVSVIAVALISCAVPAPGRRVSIPRLC